MTLQFSFFAFICAGLVQSDKVDKRLMVMKGYDLIGWHGVADFILIGSIFAMFPTILDCLISQTRIIYRVSKDNLMPKNLK